MKVLVTDPISPKGLEVLRKSSALQIIELGGVTEAQLIAKVSDADALIVRSQTKVTAPVIAAAPKLRVVGRAGVGVDNVDVDAATQRGIVVLNTPSGNSLSAAEHTVSLMMALARNIPQAHASMRAGQWDRKSFQGVELFEKTLGVIGMGRIGTEVARRAVGLGMRVIAFDPFLTQGRAAALQVEPVDLPTLYAQSDFITIHIPLTDETRGMIGKKQFAQMKRGVRLINCARGGIIVERDLADAIKSGQVAGAALDVFEEEPPPADFPLRKLDAVVMTPHLGAATVEAQERVGVEIAQAVFDFLTTGTIRNAVNAANLDVKTVEALRPYLLLGEKLGKLVAQLAQGKVSRLHITYLGKASELQFNPISRAALKGFLENYQNMGGAGVPPVPSKTAVKEFTESRRRLPHLQSPGKTYFLTFRTAANRQLSANERDLVLNACRFWNGKKVELFAATVMPDHVHLLLRPLPIERDATTLHEKGFFDLSEILHSIKSFSTHEINKMAGTAGRVWQDETFDRIVRDEGEFQEKWNFIATNSVRKNLASAPAEYRWYWNFLAEEGTGGTPAPPQTVVINEINAPAIAEQLGIHLEESKVAQSADYTEMISVEASLDGGSVSPAIWSASTGGTPAPPSVSAAATFFGSPNNPRIVRINEMFVEAQPSGVLLTFINKDRPGIVGEIGTLLGKHKVNIASMSLSRNTVGGEALTVINLDSVPPPAALEEIEGKPDIRGVKVVVL
jgi:D-3-phosphoglycerate dehydrogenase